MEGGQAAVRLIEHILINSISPPCNRPHGYLLARAPEKHAMSAIPRETETPPTYLGNARAHVCERARWTEERATLYVREGVCVCVCAYMLLACTYMYSVWCTRVQERGDRTLVCVEPEVRAGSRTAGASVLGSPATSSFRFTRANHRPTNWSVLRDRFRAPSIPSRPPSKSHAFSRECSAINSVIARALRLPKIEKICIF